MGMAAEVVDDHSWDWPALQPRRAVRKKRASPDVPWVYWRSEMMTHATETVEAVEAVVAAGTAGMAAAGTAETAAADLDATATGAVYQCVEMPAAVCGK